MKSDSRAILAIHTHLIAHNPRLSVTHNGHNTWKLHISNVQKNDSGTYMCQVNTEPMRSQVSEDLYASEIFIYMPAILFSIFSGFGNINYNRDLT